MDHRRTGLAAKALTARLLAVTATLSAGTTYPMPPSSTSLDTVVAAALADAARRSGLAPAALTVHSAEAVTWRDGSLGCPQPGMAYTQALVPGFRVRVRAGERLLDYHAGRDGRPQWCPPGRAQEPLTEDARR